MKRIVQVIKTKSFSVFSKCFLVFKKKIGKKFSMKKISVFFNLKWTKKDFFPQIPRI